MKLKTLESGSCATPLNTNRSTHAKKYFEHPHPRAVVAQEVERFPAPSQLSSLQHCKCAARILILCCWALQGYSAVGHCRDTFRLGPAGIFGGWTLQGYGGDALQLGTAGILCGWALQGYLVVEHCRDTLRLGSVRILISWALQGYSAVGYCRDTWWLGTAGILCGWAHPLSIAGILIGWALQGYSAVRHCRDTWWLGTAGILGGWSLKSALSRARTTSTLKSNNPTARVRKNTDNSQHVSSWLQNVRSGAVTLNPVVNSRKPLSRL